MMQEQRTKRTVFAATAGEYSDYSVVAIFDRREDAERFVATHMADRVEEMDLYSEMPPVYTVYRAQIAKHNQSWSSRPAGEVWVTSHVSLDQPEHAPSDLGWAFAAEGPDRERVIKSVRDRYAKWKATEAGLTPDAPEPERRYVDWAP